jgi:GMP synthase-like glutamine amidotransferase
MRHPCRHRNNVRVAPKVLFIYNEHLATEALLGEAFAEQGFDIDTFEVVPAERVDEPAVDVTFPDPVGYDAIVPLGARWPVYDDALRETWVGSETQLVRDAADAGVPLLGVCFGGQLLAQAFGGTVARSTVPEIGWYEVESDHPDLVPGGRWFQWHFDRWTLPPGATEIARTANSSQAFVLGRALALQFHPEIDGALLELWLAEDRDGEVAGAGLSHDELRQRTTELTDDAAKRIRGLVRGFLTHVARQPCPSS